MVNREMAADTLRLIEANKAAFRMDTWATWVDTEYGEDVEPITADTVREGSCGTTACAAGFAALAHGDTLKRNNDSDAVAVDSSGRVHEEWFAYGAWLLDIPTMHADHLFVAPGDLALKALKAMADGEDYTEHIPFCNSGRGDTYDGPDGV